ncbi:unnamed protein product, partial [Brassica rapa subsp. trilocularis]
KRCIISPWRSLGVGKKTLYEAKVWVKPGLNLKTQEFKSANEDSPTITPSYLG